MTLGSGYTRTRSKEDDDLVKAFFAKGGKVTVCQPANVAESESVRATNELVAKQRKAFREKRRAKAVSDRTD